MASPRAPADEPRSLWRWDAFLPAAAAEAVSLGEGDTPLLPVPSLGLGDVWMKDESRNPTWSFKDRLASSAVTMAQAASAPRLIASSSSGNAGASAAAYAAKAGLPCIIFTFKGASGPLLTQMRAYGAMVVVSRTRTTAGASRSPGVREFGWYPTSPFFGPVVGSNPYGMEGYKTIAYEIAEAFDWQRAGLVRAAGLLRRRAHGMWKGFEELQGAGLDRSRAALRGGGGLGLARRRAAAPARPCRCRRPRNAATIATSIGANQGTVQALEVLRHTGGAAVAVDDDELVRWVVDAGASRGHLGRAVVGRALRRHRAAAPTGHDQRRTSASSRW